MKLTFKNDTFKILQIADTQEGRKVSPDTLALINAALDREEPDLVVYSGDQIWGRGFHGDVNQVRRVLKELKDELIAKNTANIQRNLELIQGLQSNQNTGYLEIKDL